MKRSFFLLIVFALLLTACAAPTAAPTQAVQPAPTLDPSLPYPPAVTTTPHYPTPAYPAAPQTERVFPTEVPPAPDANTGVITGRLLDIQTNASITNVMVAVGNIVYLTPGPDYVVSMDEKVAPRGSTDPEGRFTIGGITPGRYVLLIWTPHHTTAVLDPSTRQLRMIDVPAGVVTDLGDIFGDKPN
ncbi:MAG TPA: hypothetical protein PKW33_18010 [Anaerolineaceae bacterium]|nr:hypothetical protein [Anaerolineaceae bacterium]HPN53496.1 hypothetical protein [Anaerolineaceae bacterium]